MTLIRAVGRCLAAQLKMELTYRVNFLVGLVSQLVYSLLSIAFVGVFLPEGVRLSGWGFWEIIFLFGLADICFGLSAVLVFRAFLVFDALYVVQGELDQLLVQPIHPLFNLILRNLNVNDLITATKGACIVLVAFRQLGLDWSPTTVMMLLLGILSGAATYSGILVFLFSLGFWFPRRSSVVAPLLSLNQLAQYPLLIYPEWLQICLSFIIPLGFVVFYPAEQVLWSANLLILTSLDWKVLLLIPLLVIGMAYSIFNYGLRRYVSAGS